MKYNRYLIFAVILACITGLLIFQFLNNLSRQDYVVIARKDIERYTLIDASMVEIKGIHPNSNHSGTFSSIQDVVGQYAKEDLVKEEMILLSNVSESESYRDFTGTMTAYERAIFIPLGSENGLGGTIQAGDRVDLIYVSVDANIGISVSKTVLQSVNVLDVRSEDGGSNYNSSYGIIVSVSPYDAEKIAFCIDNGSIYMSKVPYGGELFSAKGIHHENIYD